MSVTVERPRPLWRASERPAWEEPPTKAGLGAKGLIIALCCLVVLGPLWVVIVTSLSPRHVIDSAGGLVLWPEGITFVNYKELLSGGQVSRAMLVSLGVTGFGTLFSMVVSVLAAYGLSRPGSFAHRALLMALMTTMFFSAGLIPTYLLVQTLGLTDSYLSLILPSAVSVFNVLVLRGFFMNISQELTDSARIDGAGDFRILWTIIMPLSRAVIAVISLFYAVAYWSAWFNAMIYIDDPAKLPLQNVLMQLVQKNTALPTGLSQRVNAGELSALGLQMAMMVLALIPVAVASPFVQRHFKKGMLTGAVKG
ncbi:MULTISPECIES: carbohydrate ABC transporter permease [unclassified Streptomyces]|uniref:Carbohydrate ABC transporter permease n=1 Tax=Streptomyces sp. NBC_00119 TaxID=2975659 RepID=A0AAU1UKJ9_9ACTN|nr:MULTISPECIES: carbohydrate ABC transporter permease [unclassified Streptomyces]MCX4649897.1 carbohydrate ABC transporter permease [Streptomyces sp. NBC_01446]MCX5320890.1 carbohydrate ABC transporter permease [Streptomyces sp. NBC_00120]